MLVFTIVFGKLAKLPSEGVPYPILVFAAMLPWQFFANAFSESSNSLIGNANLISKVYFPRLVISTSSLIVSFVDFSLIGLKVEAEVKTNKGRIDAVIIDKEIYIFEFKFNGDKDRALSQIKEKKDFEKYQGKRKKDLSFRR